MLYISFVHIFDVDACDFITSFIRIFGNTNTKRFFSGSFVSEFIQRYIIFFVDRMLVQRDTIFFVVVNAQAIELMAQEFGFLFLEPITLLNLSNIVAVTRLFMENIGKQIL